MANINGIRIFVKDEQFSHSVEVTSHKVEKGLPLTDNVQRNASIITIKGEIVGETASEDINTIRGYMENGTLIYYTGRNYTWGNFVITNFQTSHPNTIWGGCSFNMTIKEVRFAKSSYLRKQTASTAKVTKAGTAQLADVTTTATTNQSIKATKNAGTKSVVTSNKKNTASRVKAIIDVFWKGGFNTCIWHTCKKGDDIYSLFFAKDAPYRKYSATPGIAWTYDKVCLINGNALISKGSTEFKTGAKIIVGFEKR